MEKIISLILKLGSIILGIVFIGLGAFLYHLTSDKSGPYVETPFVIGYLVLTGVLIINLWVISTKIDLTNIFTNIAIFLLAVSGYFAFTPITTVSNAFLMAMNSGNVFTFYTADSYSLLKKAYDVQKLQGMYDQRLIITIGFLFAALLIVIVMLLKKTKQKN
ncbi:hypothetical protein RD055328_09570 [Companilactobacillus sp. RD055328]|uniref:hypothetical protein n=1 Tax=Companilactobacillus sp. RD055328 TaxID=2916634 RepID=UPI001FC8D1C8|nr:hypothetical protein [Companilactobacillus sp. RD055328]GKQ43034.1 hypothetical protein RD055328_09570 [Companilactobacillus sp. RD055328]